MYLDGSDLHHRSDTLRNHVEHLPSSRRNQRKIYFILLWGKQGSTVYTKTVQGEFFDANSVSSLLCPSAGARQRAASPLHHGTFC